MNKRKVAEIVKFNVEKSIQGKAFVILNIIMCIIIIGLTNKNNIINLLEKNDINLFEEKFKLEILDTEGIARGKFEEIYKDQEGVEISYVEENNYTEENIPDDLILVKYDLDEENLIKVLIVSKEGIDDNLYSNIEQVSMAIRSEIFAAKYGIENESLQKLNESVLIEREMLGVDAENSDFKETVSMISILIVYMVLIFVLSRLANEVVQEKLSKSIEYVLTSVTEKEYLLAKVLGTTLSIVVQGIYTFVYYLMGNSISAIINASNIVEASTAVASGSVLDISTIGYVVALFAYLIFTIFVLSLIQAVLASKVTNMADAGNSMVTILMLIIVLYMISLTCINPYMDVSMPMYIFSCLPLVSTFFIPTMIINGQATALQIIISFLVLIISIPLIFNTCAKKFKLGILDYSDKNKKTRKVKKEKTLKEELEFFVKSSKMKNFGFVIGMGLLIWLICSLLGNLLLKDLITNIWGDVLDENGISWVYYIISSILGLGLGSLLIMSYTEDEYKKTEKIDKKTGIRYLIKGLGLVALIQVIERIILPKLGVDYQVISNTVTGDETLINKILYLIGIAVVPGIFEELFIRKSIINFGKKFGNYFALIVSAIIFALMHMNVQQGIFAFFISLIFGVIAIKTKSIKITVILHIINNGFVGIQTLFGESVIAAKVFEILLIAFAVIGLITLISMLFRNRKNEDKDFKKSTLKEEYKMILSNYTFDIVMILFVILTVATEVTLRAM